MPFTKQEPCQFGKAVENRRLAIITSAAQYQIRLVIVQLRCPGFGIAGFCDKGGDTRAPAGGALVLA
jgi:hypothetical protein